MTEHKGNYNRNTNDRKVTLKSNACMPLSLEGQSMNIQYNMRQQNKTLQMPHTFSYI